MKKSPLEANLWLGFELVAWLRLLARNRFAITPTRIPLAALVTCAAAGNTALRGIQSLIYGRRVRQVVVPDDPIFIVGHWRTGTTMLHELLALDPAHRSPTTYESLSPNHFLLTEKFVRRWLPFLVPRTRPFDNMRMGFDRPQEDEAALALRGTPSPFLSASFPRRPLQSPEYVDLTSLTPRQLARWQADLQSLLQLLLFARSGRLVLKSPQHTNRIPTLHAMFPRARFIHITRDPYVVFPSTMHFWRIMIQKYGLQRLDEARLREQVFTAFAQMHDNVERARTQLPAGAFHELRYPNLTADPVGAMRGIYDFLGRDDFAAVEPLYAHYADRSRRYKTNEYADLDAKTRAEIAERWAPYFIRHSYPVVSPSSKG
jgi:hypothetical protein